MTSGVGSIEELSNIITGAPFEINGDGFGSGITAPTDGTLLRTNLCTNPSFETGTTGWSAVSGSTIAQNAAVSFVGTKSLHIERTATSAGATFTATGLTSGHMYTVSCYAFATGAQSFAITVGTAGTSVVPNGTDWARATKTFTATGTSQVVTFGVTNSVASISLSIDAVQIEEAADATDYFDGATMNTDSRLYAWTGTAHGSTSTETATYTELVEIPTASEADQIELTRDSNPGVIVFEDPEGTVQIFDPEVARTGTSAQTLGPDDYSAIDMQFDMSHIINVLTLKKIEKIGTGKKTRKVEIDMVFTDDASIAKYGKFKKTHQIHKKDDFSDYAAKVFAKNADPDNVPQSVTVTICKAGKQVSALPFGYADGTYVGNKIDITDPNGVTYTCRVRRIEHNVTPDFWQMKIFLRNQHVIQPPRPESDRTALNTEVGNNPDGNILGAHLDDDLDGTGKTITKMTFQNAEGLGTTGVSGFQFADDAVGGVLKFWTGLSTETGAGWINPKAIGALSDRPAVEFASPQDAGGRSKIQLATDQSVFDTPNATFTGNLAVDGGGGFAGTFELDKASGSILVIPFLDANTGGSANVNWNSSNGNLRVISSARRFKADEEPLEVDVNTLLALTPKAYIRLATDEDPGGPEVGFIAEDAEELGLTPWVVYDRDGRVFSFDYFKWVVALQAIVRRQQQQIDALTERLDRLEGA